MPNAFPMRRQKHPRVYIKRRSKKGEERDLPSPLENKSQGILGMALDHSLKDGRMDTGKDQGDRPGRDEDAHKSEKVRPLRWIRT